MSGDVTPERLDAIMDGVPAESEAERDMLRIAAELRGAAAPAPAAVRDRVLALGEPASPANPRRRRVRWSLAVPALSALAAGIVAVGVLTHDGSTGDAPVAARSSATSSAPDGSGSDAAHESQTADSTFQTAPPGGTVAPATRSAGALTDAEVAALRSAIEHVATGAGGSAAFDPPGSGTSATASPRITIDVEPGARDTVLAQILALEVTPGVALETLVVPELPSPGRIIIQLP